MKTLHTKGEWIKGYNKGLTGPTTPVSPSPVCDDKREYIPISIRQETIAIVILPENNNKEEMEANAKLIATAPELLDVCVQLLEIADSRSQREQDILEKAISVIGKATLMKRVTEKPKTAEEEYPELDNLSKVIAQNITVEINNIISDNMPITKCPYPAQCVIEMVIKKLETCV